MAGGGGIAGTLTDSWDGGTAEARGGSGGGGRGGGGGSIAGGGGTTSTAGTGGSAGGGTAWGSPAADIPQASQASSPGHRTAPHFGHVRRLAARPEKLPEACPLKAGAGGVGAAAGGGGGGAAGGSPDWTAPQPVQNFSPGHTPAPHFGQARVAENGPGCSSGSGAGAGAPQDVQNRSSACIAAPQRAHLAPEAAANNPAPQRVQNFMPALLSAPHREHLGMNATYPKTRSGARSGCYCSARFAR